jgi:hypothetical protein
MPFEDKRKFNNITKEKIKGYIIETLNRIQNKSEIESHVIHAKKDLKFHGDEIQIAVDRDYDHSSGSDGKIIVSNEGIIQCSVNVSWKKPDSLISSQMEHFWEILNNLIHSGRRAPVPMLYGWYSESELKLNDGCIYICLDKDGKEVEVTNFSKTDNAFSYIKDIKFVAMVQDGRCLTNDGKFAVINYTYRRCLNCQANMRIDLAEKQDGLCSECLKSRVCDLCGNKWTEGFSRLYVLTSTTSTSLSYPYTLHKEQEIARAYGSVCEKCFREQTGTMDPADTPKKKGLLGWLESDPFERDVRLKENFVKDLATTKLYELHPYAALEPNDFDTGEARYYIRSGIWWHKNTVNLPPLNLLSNNK